MRIALLQTDIAWEDVSENHRRAARLLTEAAAGGARLAILPEMFSTGFSMDSQRIAQPPGGLSESFLREQARSLNLWVLASIPESGDPFPRNMALLVSPEGAVTRYAKIHPFSFAGEHEHYAAGSSFLTTAIEGVRVSGFVCYDLRFADEFWAVAPATDCYVVVANWPAVRRHHWRSLLVARAIENQAYVVGVNRVGTDGGGLEHAGDSMIVDPLGEVLASAAGGETVLVADVDPAVVAGVRARFPFLADRRA